MYIQQVGGAPRQTHKLSSKLVKIRVVSSKRYIVPKTYLTYTIMLDKAQTLSYIIIIVHDLR